MDAWITTRLYPDASQATIIAQCTVDASVTITVALVEVLLGGVAEVRALQVGAGQVQAETSPGLLSFRSLAMPAAPIQTYPPTATVPGLYLAVAEGTRSGGEAIATLLERGRIQGPGEDAVDSMDIDMTSGADLWREGGGLPGPSVFCDVSVAPNAGLEAGTEEMQTLLTLRNTTPPAAAPPVLVAGPRRGVVRRMQWRPEPVDGWYWGTADLSSYGAMDPGEAVVWSVETDQHTLREILVSEAQVEGENSLSLALPNSGNLEIRYTYPPVAVIAAIT